MKLENIRNRPLSETEVFYKKQYLSSEQGFWKKPMTAQEYKTYAEEGGLSTLSVDYYFSMSKGGLGNTVNEVSSSYNVIITLHNRYSYPILHNHEYIEIIYVAAGSCENFFSEFSLAMKEGDVCIMSPFAIHAISCVDEDSCILNIMVSKKFFDQNFLHAIMSGKTVANYLEEILYHRASTPYILFPTGQDAWLNELARRLLTESKRKRQAYEYSISLLASSFLIHLTREYEAYAMIPSKQSFVPSDLMVAILGYISVNYNRTSLAKISEFFGYSESYLSRYIHKNVGKSFHTIITEIQMEHAQKLLIETDMNYTEVAIEIGCFDLSHFNKKFKAIYGETPRQYRCRHTLPGK